MGRLFWSSSLSMPRGLFQFLMGADGNSNSAKQALGKMKEEVGWPAKSWCADFIPNLDQAKCATDLVKDTCTGQVVSISPLTHQLSITACTPPAAPKSS